MVATQPGREPVQIVEIKQPFCSRTFGVAPCAATGTADEKCYNTRATCLDPDNFALGDPLSLYFSTGAVAAQRVPGVPYIIPCLESVSTAPTRINLTGASPDAQGLGNRALCSIRFHGHRHSDRRVDPYRDGRSWDPLSDDRGGFWALWLARNKYRQNIEIVVHEGYAGQSLGEMVSRTYFLEKVTGPDAGGGVTITGKDILARIEARKAQAPLASPGVLYTGISAGATSFEVANAVEADYDAAGVIRIGEEIMTYTGRASSANGITFSGVSRAAYNTSAASHDVDATVQQCLAYTSERADDVVADLLTIYGGVDPAWLDTANWATEFDNYLPFYNLTTVITDPESVVDLVSEISVQVGFYLWWDERARLVKFKAIRGVDVEPDTITDRTHIIAGSFEITEKPRERASQVWVYYDKTDWIAGLEDPEAYESQFVAADLESETAELYGEKSIRKIWGRWLNAGALAGNTASKIITRYSETPSQCSFEMDAKDRDYWLGTTVAISHHMDVDAFGARRLRYWTITSAEEILPGDRVRYVAEDTTLYGRIHYIMADGTADYDPDADIPFNNCFIGDANGLLSDGTNCGRIA